MKGAYSAAIGKTIIPEKVQEQEDAVAIQSRVDWISSSGTQKMIKELTTQSNALVADAIALALINHQTPNEKQIVQKLIEANTLRKVVDTYATVK